MSESTTFFRDGMKKLLRNPLAVGAMIVLVVLIVTIIVAPAIIPYGYEEILKVDGRRDKTAANLAPFTYSENEMKYMEETGERLFPHIFGTDKLCRDYFARVIYGTRVVPDGWPVCQYSGHGNRRAVRRRGRLCRRQGGSGDDADLRYHLLPAGPADGDFAVCGSAGNSGQCH